MLKRTLGLVSLLLATTTAADAHTGLHLSHFIGGLAHPATGADHVLAMSGVGLCAGLAGGNARLAWPLAFVAAMIAGALAGMAGFNPANLETAITASVVVIGIVLAADARLPLVAGAVAIAAAGFCHGAAHGIEAPALGGASYVAGFTLATCMLHAVGLAISSLAGRAEARYALRAAGLVMAVAGIGMVAA